MTLGPGAFIEVESVHWSGACISWGERRCRFDFTLGDVKQAQKVRGGA